MKSKHISDSDQDKAEKPVKLVHYTTAEAAYKILETGTLWMRQTALMNDKEEIRLACVVKGYDENIIPPMRRNTYITSFSQQAVDETEERDYRGRLSMWHVYSTSGGVALVFNENFTNDLHEMNAHHKDCAYPLRILFDKVDYIDIKSPKELESQKEPEFIKDIGFEYENEWRVSLSLTPRFCQDLEGDPRYECTCYPPDSKDPTFLFEAKTESIRIIPQKIYTMNFNIKEYLDCIIIGPTPFDDEVDAIKNSFHRLLIQKGIISGHQQLADKQMELAANAENEHDLIMALSPERTRDQWYQEAYNRYIKCSPIPYRPTR